MNGKVLLAVMFISIAAVCSAQFAGGNGTVDNPWQIETAQHLNSVRNYLGEVHGDKHFLQNADIDLGVPPWNEGDGWNSIGNRNVGLFMGNYDGNNYKINNMNINRPYFGFDVGLFGQTEGATLKNIHLVNVNVQAGFHSGTLIGWAETTTIIDCSVTGKISGLEAIGGLAGVINNNSTVSGCYTAGQVIVFTIPDAELSYVGGITGALQNSSLTDSYSAMAVLGVRDLIGGLIGLNHHSSITGCYSVGSVSAGIEGGSVGGMVGGANGGVVTGSFWNTQTSGRNQSAGGIGLTIAQMVSRDIYENINWDFEDVWRIENGFSFPYLFHQEAYSGFNLPGPYNLTATANDEAQSVSLSWAITGNPAYYNVYRNERLINTVDHPLREYVDVNPAPLIELKYSVSAVFIVGENELETSLSNTRSARLNAAFTHGNGTAANPYHVNSAATLSLVREHLDSHFIQTADIDLGVPPWNQESGWEPIGRWANDFFSGYYNGNGHIISGLTINRISMNQALFGYTSGAVIKNVGLKDVNIIGDNYVGGIVGRVRENTKIQNCFVTGIIKGSRSIGGIVGRLDGRNPYSEVTNCYSTATITHNSLNMPTYTGGLIGEKVYGHVINNYCIGPIYFETIGYQGNAVIGMSNSNRGTVANNYWNYESTFASSGGTDIGEGNSTREMMQAQTFAGFDFNQIWAIEEGASHPFLRWEGEEAQDHNRPFLLPPANLTGIGGVNDVNLSWDAPPEEMGVPQGYIVYRDGERVNQQLIVEREYQDTQLQTFVAYIYRVSAVYGEQESILTRKISVSTSQFAGGAGTLENPYLVEDANQLSGVRHAPDAHFRQIADIDLDVPPWNAGDGWLPIEELNGSYHGNGFVVTGLTTRSNLDSGLFSILRGNVNNLILKKVDIQGGFRTGSVAAFTNNANISNSMVTGKIKGRHDVGGFIGSKSGGTIQNSINIASVSPIHEMAMSSIGGFAGSANRASLINCYNLGEIIGSTDWGYAGALIGDQMQTTINDCFWNIESSGNTNSDLGIAKTSLEMIQEETFENWDFNEIWSIGYQDFDTYPWLQVQTEPSKEQYYLPIDLDAWLLPDSDIFLSWTPTDFQAVNQYRIYRNDELIETVDADTNVYQDYTAQSLTPCHYTIKAVAQEHEFNPSNKVVITPVPAGFAGGKGTTAEPYEVALSDQLQSIRYNPSRHYVQIQDIQLPLNFNWVPIGTEEKPFTGAFDGKGHVIENLRINRPHENFAGFFSVVDNGARLKNISLVDIMVTSGRGAGGLAAVAANNSLIINCHVSGQIISYSSTLNNYTGGLIGYNDRSNIHNSSFRGEVQANNNFIGGFVGYNYNGTIEDSYSVSEVTGNSYVGGFAGYNRGLIRNSFSTGKVTGEGEHIAGFIGRYQGGLLKNSYAAVSINVNGSPPNVGGFAGSIVSGEVVNSYWDIDTAGTEISAAGQGRSRQEMTYPYDDDTYVEWDFEDIWVADVTGEDNDGYPYLFQTRFPYPNIAVNPQPTDGEASVSLYLEQLSWEYVATQNYANPTGFRIYFNTTGNFPDGHDYVWVEYDEEQTAYHCADVLPDELHEYRTYYWKVVPTTTDPERTPLYLPNDNDGGEYHSPWRRARQAQDGRMMFDLTRYDAENVPVWSFNTFDQTDVEAIDDLPLLTELQGNYPNPFNPETAIRFSLAEPDNVVIEIFNIKGQQIVTLIDDHRESGHHKAVWNGKDENNRTVGSGVYLYRMKTKDYVATDKMILIK